jgi:hypothetical protein
MTQREYERHEVFVVGGQPTVTYNPRPSQEADVRLRDYLDEGGSVLCITGPTKSGKTVLVKQVVPRSIWISGGDLRTVEDFWRDVVDALVVYTSESTERAHVQGTAKSSQVGVSVKLAGSGLDGQAGRSSEDGVTFRHTQSRDREVRRAAKTELAKWRQPVVIDDFHHVDPATQRDIVRGLKDLVFEGVPVILVAVPHRATDIVRAEPEMTGRVDHVAIRSWTRAELEAIATQGFAALNIECPAQVSSQMAHESYGSPHLMQNFCLQICKFNGVKRTSFKVGSLTGPIEDSFFRNVARSQGSSEIRRRLTQGPGRGADRLKRRLTNGGIVDSYGAMMAAMAHTGPRLALSYGDIRAALRAVLDDESPGRAEISRVLEQMAKIATNAVWDARHERFVGDPVLEYQSDTGTVHISDPFFAFQLRWAVQPDDNAAEH